MRSPSRLGPRLRRGRLFVLLWASVYPLLLLVGAALPGLLPPTTPPPVTVLITSGLVVASMTFLFTPALLATFGAWLVSQE